MLHARTGREHSAANGASILPAIAAVDRFADESSERRRRLAAEQALDAVLEDSFPASDPPSWNSGFARPSPTPGSESRAHRSVSVSDSDARTGESRPIDVSRAGRANRTFLESVVSLAGATGIALLVPVAILLVGLPIVLVARGLLEAIGWLFGIAVP